MSDLYVRLPASTTPDRILPAVIVVVDNAAGVVTAAMDGHGMDYYELGDCELVTVETCCCDVCSERFEARDLALTDDGLLCCPVCSARGAEPDELVAPLDTARCKHEFATCAPSCGGLFCVRCTHHVAAQPGHAPEPVPAYSAADLDAHRAYYRSADHNAAYHDCPLCAALDRPENAVHR